MSDIYVLPPCARLLLVDDSRTSRLELRRILMEIENVEVVEAESGEEAIATAKEGDFAIFLLDVEMPDMDGYALARILKSNPKTSNTPIIFVTGTSSTTDNAVKAYALGAVDFISKPAKPEVLQAKVKVFCDLHWQREQLKTLNAELAEASAASKMASQSKSAFLANMSHEIRTPLNGIIGTTELLRKTTLDDTQQRYTNIILSSGETLLGIINDILDLSKIEAGKTTLNYESINLAEFLRSVTEPHLPRAAQNEVDLLIRHRTGVPRIFKGDPVHLKQILFNLLSNAVKFTKKGAVTLDVEPAAPGRLRFTVTDSGIGIANDKLDTIFESFTQADNSTTRNFGGTGLGLAITKRLGDMMGAIIGVTSTLGKGSTFWVELPAEATEPDSLPVITAKKMPKIGVVSSREKNRDMLAAALSDLGLSDVTSALSIGEFALVAGNATKETPIILFLDTSEQHDNWPEDRSKPTIVFAVPPVMQAQTKQHEKMLYLYQPYQRDDLVDVLRKANIFGPAEKQQSVPDEGVQKDQNKTILLVEDDAVNRMIAEEMLNQMGYRQIAIAENGLKAVEMCDVTPYDVILMDCMMPKMDGYQATQLIREKSAANKNTPIIALTASALASDREKCLKAGMSDFLGKPFRLKDLQAILMRHIKAA